MREPPESTPESQSDLSIRQTVCRGSADPVKSVKTAAI